MQIPIKIKTPNFNLFYVKDAEKSTELPYFDNKIIKRQLKKKKDNLLLSFKTDHDFTDNQFYLPSPNKTNIQNNTRLIDNSPKYFQAKDSVVRLSNYTQSQRDMGKTTIETEPQHNQTYRIAAQANSTHRVVPMPSPVKVSKSYFLSDQKEKLKKKEDSYNIYLLLKKLNNSYIKNSNANVESANILFDLLEIFCGQNNLYKDEMKILYQVIKKMVYCHDTSIRDNFQEASKYDPRLKIEDNLVPPYFHCVDLFNIQMCNTKSILERQTVAFQKQIDDLLSEISDLKQQLQSCSKVYEERISDLQSRNNAEFIQLKKDYVVSTKKNTQYHKEILSLEWQLNDQLEHTKVLDMNIETQSIEIDKQAIVIIDLKAKVEQQEEDFLALEDKIPPLLEQIKELKEKLIDKTRRPSFQDFDELFEQIKIEQDYFDKIKTTGEKLQLINTKLFEYSDDLTKQTKQEIKILQSKKSPLTQKLKESRRLSTTVSMSSFIALASRLEPIQEEKKEVSQDKKAKTVTPPTQTPRRQSMLSNILQNKKK